jgi:quinol monooxygenase YgiN
MPYYHVILERYTAPFTPEEEREIEETYQRIRTELPGCLAYLRGPNVSPFAKDFTHVHISVWTDKAAHDAYQTHPLHDRLVHIIVPKLEAAVADLDVMDPEISEKSDI